MRGDRFTIIALSVFTTERVAVSLLNIYRSSMPQLSRELCLDLTTVLLNWLLPIVIVYKIEKRDRASLGLNVPSEKHVKYLLYATLSIVAPMLYFGFSTNILTDLLEQILFIGLAEEFFYRGYLMTRLDTSLGNTKGLLLNATLFSLAHVIYIITNEGIKYPVFLTSTTIQTFAGGLLLGYIYQRSKNIVPSSIIHVTMNLYLSRLLA